METALTALLPRFDAARAARESLALATLIHTAGSTYRKTGAQMLIANDGDYVGLLSGGCLEGDLREHARSVIANGSARIVRYDLRGPDDELWGLGSGCEGAMDILLQRLGPVEAWQPLATIANLVRAGQQAIATLLLDMDSRQDGSLLAQTSCVWRCRDDNADLQCVYHAAASPLAPDTADELHAALARELNSARGISAIARQHDQVRWIALRYAPAPSLLLLGAGPDSRPLAQLAQFMGWRVTLYDHRAALLDPKWFPSDCQLLTGSSETLLSRLDPTQFSAVIIMSHHLSADRHYLQALASAPAAYTGLLGPASRRDKLLSQLQAREAAALRGRLRAPVGLELGGRNPEAIALGIVADIHSFLNRRSVAVTG